MGDVRAVFDSIARCKNVALCYKSEPAGGCEKIIRSQSVDEADFQLPEPWVGRIDKAPILFVSSNPSIGEDVHATISMDRNRAWEIRQFAFGGGERPYILDGKRSTDEHGNVLESVAYWAWAQNRAQELIPDRKIEPGVDYALTEVVHCKSKKQAGVREALAACTRLHLEGVLSVAAADLFVIVGSHAKKCFFGTNALPKLPVVREMGGRARMLVFFHHPNKPGGLKTFGGCYSEKDLDLMRSTIRRHG